VLGRISLRYLIISQKVQVIDSKHLKRVLRHCVSAKKATLSTYHFVFYSMYAYSFRISWCFYTKFNIYVSHIIRCLVNFSPESLPESIVFVLSFWLIMWFGIKPANINYIGRASQATMVGWDIICVEWCMWWGITVSHGLAKILEMSYYQGIVIWLYV
jgi:hypothetical protein